jgi:transglutaminase-like putative cysteine protease
MAPPVELEPPDPRDVRKLADFRHQADLDAIDPRVVALATRLVRPFAPDDWLGQAREIHRWVRDAIRYQHDPDRRQLMVPANETVENGWGNCVGKSILVAALLRALGMKAELMPVFSGPVMTHLMYRVKFPGSAELPDSLDGWLYGEQTIRGAELGQNPHTIARNPDTGSLPLAGGPPPAFWRQG